MKTIYLFLFLSLGFFSCEKEEAPAISGTYKGIFFRSSPGSRWPQSQVTLNLNANSYTGHSSDARYPAICHGSWMVEDETMNFENNCIWTTDFDGSLILSGEYQFEINGDNLKIWRMRGEARDMYVLRKE